jgi:hypothetical protein
MTLSIFKTVVRTALVYDTVIEQGLIMIQEALVIDRCKKFDKKV